MHPGGVKALVNLLATTPYFPSRLCLGDGGRNRFPFVGAKATLHVGGEASRASGVSLPGPSREIHECVVIVICATGGSPYQGPPIKL